MSGVEEAISIRRQSGHTAVNVTHRFDGHTVHWKEDIYGADRRKVKVAIIAARNKCVELAGGIEDACSDV